MVLLPYSPLKEDRQNSAITAGASLSGGACLLVLLTFTNIYLGFISQPLDTVCEQQSEGMKVNIAVQFAETRSER